MIKKEKPKYEITEIIGTPSPNVDLTSGLYKIVLTSLIAGDDIDAGILKDIRSRNDLGLTVQEAHMLTNILLKNGYGSLNVLESEYIKRKVGCIDD